MDGYKTNREVFKCIDLRLSLKKKKKLINGGFEKDVNHLVLKVLDKV